MNLLKQTTKRKRCIPMKKKISVGNIITSSVHNPELLVTKVHDTGVEAKHRMREGGLEAIVLYEEITDVTYLHGDYHSYMLLQDWA